jgi:hypothetical protein
MLSVSHRCSGARALQWPHAHGQDRVGLDALIGGLVVMDEQGLVEQEAPGRTTAGEARRWPLQRSPT